MYDLFSRRAHGVIDYIVGAVLILSPYIFGFSEVSGAGQVIPQTLGVIIILMSLMTRYELGLFKVIPFTTHLTVDTIAALFLAASPWLFGFSDQTKWPHLIAGLGYALISVLTKRDNAAPVDVPAVSRVER
jgi:hypothetical protein